MPAIADRPVPDYWTKADLEWRKREDEGVRPNPIPNCRAYCVGCGEIVVDASGSTAIHAKCHQLLTKLPALYRYVYSSKSRSKCGHNLVDPSERWDA